MDDVARKVFVQLLAIRQFDMRPGITLQVDVVLALFLEQSNTARLLMTSVDEDQPYPRRGRLLQSSFDSLSTFSQQITTTASSEKAANATAKVDTSKASESRW